MGKIAQGSLNTASITIVAVVAAVTLISVTDHAIPSVLETIVTLVLGAGAGAVGGYGVGKAETAEHTNGTGVH